MKSIFISYRRADTSGYGGRLYEALEEHFGDAQVFRDIEGIKPGANFVDTLERAVASSGVMLVVIGQEWLGIADSTGKRRLDDPEDFVRLEITSALQLGIDVVPVLVEGAQMPATSELPEPISGLAHRQAIELSEHRWQYDSGRLIASLEEIVGKPVTSTDKVQTKSLGSASPVRVVSPKVLPVLAAVAVVVIFALFNRGPSSPEESQPDLSTSSNAQGAITRTGDGNAQTVELDKTVWYFGFRITLEQAKLQTVEGKRLLRVPVSLENQGDGTTAPDRTMFVSSNNRNYEMDLDSDLPEVPGRATGKGLMTFDVTEGEFSLKDAVITLGRSNAAQAVVPLGSAGRLVTLEPAIANFPRHTLGAGALTLEVAGGQARGDYPASRSYEYQQAPKGRRYLILEFKSIATDARYGYNVTTASVLVKLPDGTTVASAYLNEAVYPNQPVRDVKASYLINDPPKGTYALILTDGTQSNASASVDFEIGPT